MESTTSQTPSSQGAEARDPTTTLLPPSLTLADKMPEETTTKGAAAQRQAAVGKTKVGPDTVDSGKLDVKPESSFAGSNDNAAKTRASGCCSIS